MLYDTRWDANVKADPLKIETLVAWLEQQHPKAEYCYEDTAVCLLAKYFGQSEGKDVNCTGTMVVRFEDGTDIIFPVSWHNKIAEPTPHTFGAALKRAREYAAVRFR